MPPPLRLLTWPLLLIWPGVILAQSFPVKPLRLIVRAPPGGADDPHAHIPSQHLPKVIGQPVVMEYRPGAGGLVAWELTAKAPPISFRSRSAR
jgi:tripartite-type tricarboxylate transporter receptor subunit TctC